MGKYLMLSVLWLSSTGGAVALKVFESPAANHYKNWLTVVSVVVFFAAVVCIVIDSDEGR